MSSKSRIRNIILYKEIQNRTKITVVPCLFINDRISLCIYFIVPLWVYKEKRERRIDHRSFVY